MHRLKSLSKMGGEIIQPDKLSKTEDEETSSRNLEKPEERSVGVGIQVYRHTHTHNPDYIQTPSQVELQV